MADALYFRDKAKQCRVLADLSISGWVADMLRKLAREFESCVYGLNLVKGDLQEMQHPITQQARQIVM